MSALSAAVRLPILASARASGASGARRVAPARLGAARAVAPLPANFSGVAGLSRRARGALVVRNDAIDDAAALASAGPNTVTGPVASEVVPKLPAATAPAR